MIHDEDLILTFWGKARPEIEGSLGWHAAPYHLIDVAASVEAILRARRRLLERGARLLGLGCDETLALTVTLAVLHDLGKYAWRFQAKVPDRYPVVLGAWRAPPIGASHAADGLLLWERRLEPQLTDRLWPGSARTLGRLAQAVFGHHGRPVQATRDSVRDVYGDAGLEAACRCATILVDLWLPCPIEASPAPATSAARASWWLSGVITLADWVGSQEAHFPYEAAVHTVEHYRAIARERALGAVHACGLVPPPPAPARDFASVTGIAGAPTPAQRWAADVVLPDGPVLVLLEDVTGAGKTEAAQMLVHRLITEGRTTGAYWAMPTQATANAMYERQRSMIDGLYAPDGQRPSLVLAHGQSRLSARFRHTVLRPDGLSRAAVLPDDPDHGDTEPTSTASCAAFLADDRRTALLADVGAGTIDQALLAALPSRFNALRLAGLADKVLVLDEAHAYDAYMGEEIAALLRFQAALGGSAVVLSATLARAQWEALVRAWQDGTGLRRDAIDVPARASAYPLATVVAEVDGRGLVTQVALDASPRSRRDLRVEMVRSVADVVDHIVSVASRGAAVAWIRNTVDECLGAAVLLRERGIDPLVFHARFAQGDRQRREREVVELFGRPDDSHPDREERRRGRVLVATQVVEQSLDIDFDAMVSDLAPVDLLIQRAGRLWRHGARDEWRRGSGVVFTFFVLSPEATETPADAWPGPLLPKIRKVYEHVGVLWRTARVLERTGRIVAPGTPGDPGGLRSLIETVYEAGEADVPAPLRGAADRAYGTEGAKAAAGRYAVLKVADGYDGHGAAWVDDVRPITRLGGERTTVRLARVGESGALEPWESDTSLPDWHRWALSEVRLSAFRVPDGASAPPVYADAVAALRARWGRWEQEITVVPMIAASDGSFRGQLMRAGRSPITLVVDWRWGLSFAVDAATTVGGLGDRRSHW